jgi:hypothetical protein
MISFNDWAGWHWASILKILSLRMGIGGTKITIKTNIGVGIKYEAQLDFNLNFIAYTTCTLQPDKYLTKYLIHIPQISHKYLNMFY